MKDLWLAMANGDVVVGWRSSGDIWFDNDPSEHSPIAAPVAFAEFVTPKHPDAK